MESSYSKRLEEIDEKYRKPEKDKKKKKKKHKAPPKQGGLNGVLQPFNEKQAKGNLNNTLLKTVADLAGVGLGTAVSAAAGKAAPLIGAALIGTGHYIGDESGLLRVVGAATVAHSVAKSKEYRQEGSTMKDRLAGLKDDWLRAAMMKHEAQKAVAAAVPVSPAVTPAPEPIAVTPEPPKPKAIAVPPVFPPLERRKTTYELEIERHQRELEEEAEQLRAEMGEDDRARAAMQQTTEEPQEIDMSGLDTFEHSLYGAAQQHLQGGDFGDFEADELKDDDPDDFGDLTPDEPPGNDPGIRPPRQLWPPEPQAGQDDYLDDEDYNFNDY